MSVLPELLSAAERYQRTFDKPLPLGARKRVAIITCMDSRLIPERIFGLEIGDAEVLRNAGGRITLDMIRSLTVSQEILHTKEVLIMHHTDCGGQHAHQRHDYLVGRMRQIMAENWPVLGRVAGWGLAALAMTGLDSLALHPIRPGIEGLEASVREDVAKLRASPLMPRYIPIYGFTYDTQTGAVKEVTRSPGKGAPPPGLAKEE